MKKEAACSSETSISIHKTTWCYNPGRHRLSSRARCFPQNTFPGSILKLHLRCAIVKNLKIYVVIGSWNLCRISHFRIDTKVTGDEPDAVLGIRRFLVSEHHLEATFCRSDYLLVISQMWVETAPLGKLRDGCLIYLIFSLHVLIFNVNTSFNPLNLTHSFKALSFVEVHFAYNFHNDSAQV